jgi:hypothetical protein
MEKAAKYKSRKIHSVNVASYEFDGERTEDFNGSQTISSDYNPRNHYIQNTAFR